MYKIFPVGSSPELNHESSFIAFDEYHPTGFEYPELTDIINQYDLPSIFTSVTTNDGSTTESFKFGYMLSAVICDKIKGKTFVSVCPKVGIWLWFVVIEPINKSGQGLINLMTKNKNKIDNPEVDKWYDEKRFDIPLIVKRLEI
jgi:hypothetical protein